MYDLNLILLQELVISKFLLPVLCCAAKPLPRGQSSKKTNSHSTIIKLIIVDFESIFKEINSTSGIVLEYSRTIPEVAGRQSSRKTNSNSAIIKLIIVESELVV